MKSSIIYNYTVQMEDTGTQRDAPKAAQLGQGRTETLPLVLGSDQSSHHLLPDSQRHGFQSRVHWTL